MLYRKPVKPVFTGTSQSAPPHLSPHYLWVLVDTCSRWVSQSLSVESTTVLCTHTSAEQSDFEPSFLSFFFEVMASRGCANSPDSFCYICGTYTVKKQQRNISDFVKKVYFAYFGIKLGDQEKSWAPHKVCSVCLKNWDNGSKVRRNHFVSLYPWFGENLRTIVMTATFVLAVFKVLIWKIKRRYLILTSLQLFVQHLMDRNYQFQLLQPHWTIF